MKRWGGILILVFCHTVGLYAQQYDKHWLCGWMGNGGYDTLAGNYFNNFSVKIKEDSSPDIQIDSLGISFDRFNITMSDASGDSLLFYTNGVTFWNKHHQVMQNGDSLAWGWLFTDYAPDYYRNGTPAPKRGLCLPTKDEHVFYFFYTNVDWDSVRTALKFNKLFMSRIDIEADHLTFKDSTVVDDELQNQFITAVKASNNGWWLVSSVGEEGCLHLVHIDSTNYVSQQKVCNSNFLTYSNAALVNPQFTQDGSKLVIVGADYDYAGMEIMNFDRCTGEFSLVDKFNLPMLPDSSWIPWGVTSSPNSRFIYAMCSSVILQFDLWAADIKNSMKVVAHTTGSYLPFPTDFMMGQSALDGKIYVNSGSGNYAYSVIESPDEEGVACNVVQDIRLPAYLGGFPYYPNYRLGTADCWGVGIEQVSKAVVRSYPNPTSSKLWVEYDGIVWEASDNITLHVHDGLGREMYTKNLPIYSGIHKVDVREWNAGLYFYSIEADGGKIGSGKFVKE